MFVSADLKSMVLIVLFGGPAFCQVPPPTMFLLNESFCVDPDVPTGNERAEANWRNCHMYDATYLKDRRVRCFLIHKNGKGSGYITFALKPDWLIEECRVFGNPGEPINYLEFDKKDIAHWESYAGQQIAWRELQDDAWVPEKVVTWSKQEKFSEEVEIQFLGWRLGKDVQLEQLDEARFVPELIQKDTNFSEIGAAFLQPSKKRSR